MIAIFVVKTLFFLEEYESKEGSIRNLDILFIPELRHIRVRTVTDDGYNFSFGIDKRINYCPYCGKKLKTFNDVGEIQ